MPRKKKDDEVESEVQVVEPSLSIIEAKIKDDFCDYRYEHVGGKSAGFDHGVKGKGIIDDDLRDAFSKLNVHLAVIDEVFKHKGIDFASISTMHNDPTTHLYHVTGFKIKGGIDNESIVLIGNKYLSTGSRMDLETPKIAIESTSSYQWYNELKEAADECRAEVLAYHNGKFTPVKEDEEEEGPLKQTKLKFEKPSAEEFDTEE